MMKAAFLDWESLDANDLQAGCLTELPVDWRFYARVTPAELESELGEADILVTNKVILSHEHIAHAGKLQLICVAATGTNNVDLQSAARHGIPVCNVTGYATESVVQHVFMLILNLARQLPSYTQALQQGRWQTSEHFCFLDYSIQSLTGKTLGIVGYGELGRAVANMAQHFGMNVLIAQRLAGDKAPDRIPLDELLGRVDVLSLHCPLTDTTRNLIGTEQLRRMKPTAILINTARGGIVDEAALLEALDNRIIAAAALDVLSKEPPDNTSLLLAQKRTNLIITPHVAWAAQQARQKLVEGIAANIRHWLRGEAINRVN